MQLRLNDVTVNDVPRFLTDKPTPLTHALVIPTDDFDDPYVIPMSLHGVSSTFPTRKPTVDEYETLPHLVLTSEEPRYDPHDPALARREEALAKAVLETGDRIGALPPRRLCLVSKTLLDASGSDRVQLALKQISTVHDDAALCDTMQANISTVRSASAGPSNQLGDRCEDSRKDSPSNHAKGHSHSTPPDAVPSLPNERQAATLSTTTNRLLHRHIVLKHCLQVQQ
jgi:hypothetical protein